MAIVNWTTDNVDETQLVVSSDVTMMLLQMTPKELNCRWQGKLIIKPRAKFKSDKVRVELRKSLYGASVVIKIFDRVLSGKNVLVNMSMSAAAGFTTEEMNEMNFAVAEAIAVYKLPDHWIKLNKYIEESNERKRKRNESNQSTPERASNGKFTKATFQV